MSHAAPESSFLSEINAWTGAAEETLRLSTHAFTTLPSDIPANTTYRGLISDIGQIERDIFEGNALSGNPASNGGYIEFSNTGDLDDWLNYGFDGRQVTVYRLDQRSLYVSRQLMFTGTMTGLDASNAWTRLRLRLRDRLKELALPFLTVRYQGTVNAPGTDIEGTDDFKDQLKPIIYGTVRNISPKLVNPFSLLYQVSFGSVSSIVVKQGGILLTNAGDFITLEALIAAALPLGQYGTCLAVGVFRLESSPTHPITADVIETTRSVPNIARQILEDFGITDLDTTSFDDAETFNNAQSGIYLEDNRTTIELVSSVLDSLGMALIPDLFGEYKVVILRDPTALTPVTTLDLNNIGADQSLGLLSGQSAEGEGIPAYSVVLNYNRNMTPMDISQLGAILGDEEKAALGAESKVTTAQDLDVRTAHPLAAEIVKDTYLVEDADADAEALRLLNLFKVRRDRIEVQIHDEDADDIELGDCVTVMINRFGFDAGKKFLVLGRTDQYRLRMVKLRLWG